MSKKKEIKPGVLFFRITCQESKRFYIGTFGKKNINARIRFLQHKLKKGGLWTGKWWRLQYDYAVYKGSGFKIEKVDRYGSLDLGIAEETRNAISLGFMPYEDLPMTKYLVKAMNDEITRYQTIKAWEDGKIISPVESDGVVPVQPNTPSVPETQVVRAYFDTDREHFPVKDKTPEEQVWTPPVKKVVAADPVEPEPIILPEEKDGKIGTLKDWIKQKEKK